MVRFKDSFFLRYRHMESRSNVRAVEGVDVPIIKAEQAMETSSVRI